MSTWIPKNKICIVVVVEFARDLVKYLMLYSMTDIIMFENNYFFLGSLLLI